MSKETKNFGKFLACTEFAKNLIETFIPLILYKSGFSINDIIIYILFVSIFSLIISGVVSCFYHKISDRFLVGVGGVCLFALYITMQNVGNTLVYLIGVALIYSLYRRTFWIGKRYYSVYTMSKEKKATTGGIIVTITQVTKLLTSVIGGILLDKDQIILLSTISMIAVFVGILYLSKINTEEDNVDSSNQNINYHERVDISELVKIVRKHSISDLLVIFGYEGLFVIDFFMPLYFFLYVEETYSFVGWQNFIIGISSIIFVMLFSKRIDHTKRDYIRIVALCVTIILICQINVVNPVVILILSTLNGWFSKFHMVAYVRKLWCVEAANKAAYNMFLELMLGIARLTMIFIIYIFAMDLKVAIYLGIAFFALHIFIKFKPNVNL